MPTGEGKGRDRNFTKDQIITLWIEYKEDIKANPKYEYVVNQRSGEVIPVPKERPLTQVGFYAYVYNKTGHHIAHYFDKKHTDYTDLFSILSHVENERKADIYEGAAAGMYNANISARIEGLKEQSDITSNDKAITSVSVTIVKPDGN